MQYQNPIYITNNPKDLKNTSRSVSFPLNGVPSIGSVSGCGDPYLGRPLTRSQSKTTKANASEISKAAKPKGKSTDLNKSTPCRKPRVGPVPRRSASKTVRKRHFRDDRKVNSENRSNRSNKEAADTYTRSLSLKDLVDAVFTLHKEQDDMNTTVLDGFVVETAPASTPKSRLRARSKGIENLVAAKPGKKDDSESDEEDWALDQRVKAEARAFVKLWNQTPWERRMEKLAGMIEDQWRASGSGWGAFCSKLNYYNVKRATEMWSAIEKFWLHVMKTETPPPLSMMAHLWPYYHSNSIALYQMIIEFSKLKIKTAATLGAIADSMNVEYGVPSRKELLNSKRK